MMMETSGTVELFQEQRRLAIIQRLLGLGEVTESLTTERREEAGSGIIFEEEVDFNGKNVLISIAEEPSKDYFSVMIVFTNPLDNAQCFFVHFLIDKETGRCLDIEIEFEDKDMFFEAVDHPVTGGMNLIAKIVRDIIKHGDEVAKNLVPGTFIGYPPPSFVGMEEEEINEDLLDAILEKLF